MLDTILQVQSKGLHAKRWVGTSGERGRGVCLLTKPSFSFDVFLNGDEKCLHAVCSFLRFLGFTMIFSVDKIAINYGIIMNSTTKRVTLVPVFI